MTRRPAILVLFMALISLSGGMAATGERTGPKIEAAETRHDFGKVRRGIQAVHVFEIKNSGDEVLEIHKIQSS